MVVRNGKEAWYPALRWHRARHARLGALLASLLLVSACADGGGSPADGGSGALLAAPAPEDGMQLTLTVPDVPIGGETEVCQRIYLPSDHPVDVGGFEIKQPLGSHHFVLWAYEGTQAELYPEGLFEAGGCNGVGPPDSMNLAQVAGAGDDYEKIDYPAGTGIRLRAGQAILLNSHYTNPTGEPFSPTVYVNLYYANTRVDHPLEAAAIGNYNIFVPPGKTRVTTARWTVPFDLYMIMVASHEHKRGDKYTARIAAGEVDRPQGDRVGRTYGDDVAPEGSEPEPGDFYRSQDWEHPTVLTYDEPRLFRAGTVVEFSCAQHNDRTDGRAVTFGPLSDDEMCFLVGLYYRAAGAPPPGTRIPGCLPQDAQLICSADPVSSGETGPPVCGDGRKARQEQCDRGAANGSGGCTRDCELALPGGVALGTRLFPIVFSGPTSGTTELWNSVIGGSSIDGTLGVVSDAPLSFTAGALDANGSAPVAQDAEVRLGIALLGGSGSFCARFLPTPSAGRVFCRGGAGTNIRATLDNASGTAQPTDARIEIGQGDDSGPGAASLLLNASLLSIPGAPQDCLTRDWSRDPVYPIPFTTGNATGTITSANAEPGTTVLLSRDGESFDCARWSDGSAPGVLQAMPFLAPSGAPGLGDVIAQLALAGRPAPDDGEGPTPTPTPVPTEIGGELLAIRDEIFAARCATASCHSSASQAGSLVLAGDDVYDQLVGHLAANPVARAAGVLRVAPGRADESFLVRKLAGDLDAGEGSRMPLAAAPLPDVEIERIRAWIAAGAPPR